MRGKFGITLAAAMLLLIAASLYLLFAESDAEKRERLRQEMGKLTAELQSAHKARDRESRELAVVEVKVSKLTAKLHKTELKTGKVVKRLKALMTDLQPIEDRLATQRKLLNQQVRSSFLMGRQQQLRLMLSLDDPSRVRRIATYYNYLIRARSQIIRDVRQTFHQLLETGREIRAEEQRLQALKSEQLQLLNSLHETRDARQQALIRWSEKIRTADERLKIVKEDALQLGLLTQRLTQRSTEEPVVASAAETDRESASRAKSPQHRMHFLSSRGKLPWPLTGKRIQHFGELIIGDVRHTGMVIRASKGSQVHAVYPGKVVFADWLRGYGLLMILDHGDGFMSLYGYNQSLLKSVGDHVSAGDVITLSGESGGQQQASLYFAIRKGVKAFDPVRWCVRAEGENVG
jgi:septal ring factor EnvC (AmiA/AmiB activator)